MRQSFLLLILLISFGVKAQNSELTYAEKLGYPKGKKVLIVHVDDVGMSYESNQGAIKAIKEGVATSLSVMMPCGWVPGFVHYLKENPETDAGLHLTMTSEWKDYRWGPLAGKNQVKGMVDSEGAMWRGVADVVKNASPDEVEKEIRAQLDRARTMGFTPTHLDSHMGTLFATPEFLQRYLKVGMEEKIPVMFPGGHNSVVQVQEKIIADQLAMTQMVGKQLWDAGLPVLDDLENSSYGWKGPESGDKSEKALQKYKTQKYIEAIKNIKPGLTMVIMHCTIHSEIFPKISDSFPTREGDFLAMIDPELRKYIEKEGIILTTWREAMQRRQKVK
ncbi:polysaccharide deacetylase family protein [Dyadobacter frigoris]|uniref:ChbG/HpnK family deacetylase n=1 Tax=Dyadobacter frigoris TaxID=2576211 RepID=A0A4U6DGQ7_9BACT|nr:polysaccharide deacetylase family protein [Dyadobacter frigoris]TKT93844.1 ChbG/HpnK family deacetylase [Dyadobacter frigoris]GLU50939.1 carbohydrate deacetylase [Dyadobacter frigoris]